MDLGFLLSSLVLVRGFLEVANVTRAYVLAWLCRLEIGIKIDFRQTPPKAQNNQARITFIFFFLFFIRNPKHRYQWICRGYVVGSIRSRFSLDR